MKTKMIFFWGGILLIICFTFLAVSVLFCPMAMAAPASMPNDVQMVQPDPLMQKELAAFWGKWEGSGHDSGLGRQIQYFSLWRK